MFPIQIQPSQDDHVPGRLTLKVKNNVFNSKLIYVILILKNRFFSFATSKDVVLIVNLFVYWKDSTLVTSDGTSVRV